MKHIIKTLLIMFIIFGVISGFWQINNANYKKHLEIKQVKVDHPELLPDATSAKFISSGYSNVLADKYWLEAIQYIGGNAMASEYKKYLYEMTELITDLNPYFEKPYLITQLLLPNVNVRYENLSQEEIDKNLENSIKIGEKGVKNFCDATKIDTINNDKEFDLDKLTSEEKYKNPCISPMVPYYLGYIYHFYKKDGANAAKYYKITAANVDAPDGAKVLAAIMQGKGGDREKSILMFLNMAINMSVSEEDNQCKNFAIDIDNTIKQTAITGELLEIIEENRKKLTGEEDVNKLILGNSCLNFVNKATRELNLFYLENANKDYYNKTGKNADTPQILFNNGIINYIPIDFQQEKHNGIEYFYNPEIGKYDYKMAYKND
ncbi:MAG: hypothetical protein N4A38_05320 [Candidatus Gracilibacteria bacterium]|nr:hypothetical protein [Candidatus Gracilibacteria bacterium]